MYEALISDLDGTIANLDIDWEALRRRVRALLNTDHPLKPLGASIPEAARGDPRMIEEAFKIVERAELEAAMNAVHDEATVQVFSRLKRWNVKIAVVTMQAMRSAETALLRIGVRGYVDVLITRDHSLSRREQLELALKRLGVDRGRAVFVGDTVYDLKAGREAGLYTLIIGRDISNISELLKLPWRGRV